MKCPKCNSERAIGCGSMSNTESRDEFYCPDCGYSYNNVTEFGMYGDGIEELAVKDSICCGSILPQEKYTIRIENCEHIYLTQKSIDIEIAVHIQDFDRYEEIIINGRRFVRSREDECIST